MEQMEQIQISEDMRRSTVEAVGSLTLSQARDLMLSVTLTTLLPQIAAYRDQFYQRHLERLRGPIAERMSRLWAGCRSSS